MAAKDNPEDNLIREKMWVTRPKGTHLSQSRKILGESSPLIRDDDDPTKVGQVTLGHIADEDDDYELSVIDASPPSKSAAQEAAEQALQEAVGHVVDYFLAKGEFHIKKFYNEKARPALRAKWENRPRPRRRRNRQQLHANEQESIAEMKIVISEEIVEADQQYRSNMSSSKAQARIMMVLFLRALSDEQLDLVFNADIEVDIDGANDELERRFNELPSEHVTYMIESLMDDPSLIADQLLGFEKLLGLAPSDSEQGVIEQQRDQ